jgi:hypothetical protein
MYAPVSDEVRRAFAAALRELLMQRNTVTVPGLGRFVPRHEPSRVTEEAGRRALHPPVDLVAFEPEPELSPA